MFKIVPKTGGKNLPPPPISRRPRKAPGKKSTEQQPNGSWLLWALILLGTLLFFSQINLTPADPQMKYSDFYDILKNNASTQRIQSLTIVEGVTTVVRGTFQDGQEFQVFAPRDYSDLLKLVHDNVRDYTVKPAETFWAQLLFSLGPILILILFIWLISYRGAQMGNRIWSFGKSKAKIDTKKNNVTFLDVAGVDEAKEELQEVIEFLKEPKKFQRLGGRIPKGVLLVGPPGTGKTLLAKAVAGEASVPFFSLSGSDFVEMFVGVGASRVRDLFEQGRKASQSSGKGCIIFIDEIDAVGRLRFSGIGGGHDEREQTLNALLVEMDGFDPQAGLILIAATNRPDTLDPALLRPGRFDRQVVVSLPDITGREEILKVHVKNLKLDTDVNLKKVARQTVYFSGADLANVCNEAALLAARKNKESVAQAEFLAAAERVTLGPEKKSRAMSKKEKKITACHESGHALLSLLLPEVDTFTKVSIIPRGMAGGYTLTPPVEDRHYWSKKELLGRLVVILGGRAAEDICLNEITTGAQSDLKTCTEIARQMICEYGMSEKLGTLTLGQHHHQLFLGRDMMEQRNYSEETAKAIDDEVKIFIDNAYARAKKLLSEHRDQLETLTQSLMEKEVLDIDEVRTLLKMPQPSTAKEEKKG